MPNVGVAFYAIRRDHKISFCHLPAWKHSVAPLYLEYIPNSLLSLEGSVTNELAFTFPCHISNRSASCSLCSSHSGLSIPQKLFLLQSLCTYYCCFPCLQLIPGTSLGQLLLSQQLSSPTLTYQVLVQHLPRARNFFKKALKLWLKQWTDKILALR